MRLSHVDAKGASLGDPNQVMWGPKDRERTESMASGCVRTLPEEGQVCRLLTPCSRLLIMRPSTTGKALASHRTRTSREEGATDTRSKATQRASKDHGRAWGPGGSGLQDSRRDAAPDSKTKGGECFGSEKRSRDTPLIVSNTN